MGAGLHTEGRMDEFYSSVVSAVIQQRVSCLHFYNSI